MRLRYSPAPLGICAGLLALSTLIGGCAVYPSGVIPIRAAAPLTVAELTAAPPPPPRTPAAAVPARQLAPTPPEAPVSPPAPPSPLVLAMGRATFHLERGNQALRSGRADQAEWEFDAAFDALLEANLTGEPPRGFVQGPGLPDSLPAAWLYQLAVVTARALPDPEANESEEDTLEAPALVGPEDLRALAEIPADKLAPVPEPEPRAFGVPVVFNEQVKTFIQYFQTRKWGVVARAFDRARRYLPMMRQVFREKGLPEDLINLAFIESAVNPWATSKAKAAGIWQFIPSTGRMYGMQVSWWLDERRDPEKATRGAAQYLKTLYQMFDSWPLALAAYNAGEGTIQRAIQRQKTTDFWKLRLPKETQLFVPAFMAMTVIGREPERYGFAPPPDDPHAADTVVLSQPADLRVLAKAARTSVERLRELNPALVRTSTPPDVGRFPLRIPAGLKADFEEALAQIPPSQRVSWVRHKVHKGETAAAIAKRYGVSRQTFLEMNDLGKRQPLKVGSTVLVPGTQVAESAAPRAASQAKTHSARHHTVRSGDTLWEIAQTYGVSLDDLCAWNDLTRKSTLRLGQTLAVAPPVKPTKAATLEKPRARAGSQKGAAAPGRRTLQGSTR